MKALTISLTLVSLCGSASVLATDTNEQRESDAQARKIQVAASPATPDRSAKKNNSTQESAKRGETMITLPDPAFMPYVNGGHYDSQ